MKKVDYISRLSDDEILDAMEILSALDEYPLQYQRNVAKLFVHNNLELIIKTVKQARLKGIKNAYNWIHNH